MLRLLSAVFCLLISVQTLAGGDSRPNILLIVVDDMGYTDLGAFGGEIETPNLDKLANRGVRLTNFYAAPTCSPTRSMLLTGVDSHLVGLGNMHEELAPNQKGKPGYEGYLNTRAANMAEVLKSEGYNTYMTGKWHLGLEEAQSPAARGFERSFVLLNGGGGHFDTLGLFAKPAAYRKDGKSTGLPKDFYSSRFFTEEMIRYMDADRQGGKPFFAYLAYSAPHWPVQAPQASIRKYQGQYDQGYDQLVQQRLRGAIEKGVLPEGSKPAARLDGEPAWSDLTDEQRRIEARKMEIYAAMIDDVDRYVGTLLDYLKSIDQYDNTIVFFMSDNGAEGHDLTEAHGFGEVIPWVESCCDNSYGNMGKADSYVMVGPNWARASGATMKHFKGFTTEGGIKVPAFLSFPGYQPSTPLSSRFSTVKDVMPTLFSLAGIPLPGDRFEGRKVLPISGESFLAGNENRTPDMGWELMGKQGYRYGDWKVVRMPAPWGNGNWQLFNLAQDPGEQTDLALKEPKVLQSMVQRWQRYAETNGVILPDWVSGY